MLKICGFASFLLALPGHAIAQNAPPLIVFEAQGDALDIEAAGQVYAGAIPLPLEEDRTQVNLGQGTDPLEFCVIEEARRRCLLLQPGEPVDFVIRHEGRDAVLALSYLGPQASFPAAYRAANAGRIDVEIPRAYELVNVAIALTQASLDTPGLAATSPYREEVRSRFAALKTHPFVAALDKEMAEDPDSYHLLKMNGAAFDLDESNTLTRSPYYKSVGWGGNVLLPYQAEMQDFARQAEFARFYADHADFYAGQIDFMRSGLAVEDMLAWLGRAFPDVAPYDYTRILFSPLTGHNQSLARFDDEGFRELQPHVNFPYPEDSDFGFGPDAQRQWRGLILFTELNHGFINPTAEAFAQQIGDAMPDRSVWAEGSTAMGYAEGIGIFNEMMNWALVSVRAQDTLAAEEASGVAKEVARIMANNRGFTRYPLFQQRLLALAASREEGATIASLYPEIVAMLPEIAARPLD